MELETMLADLYPWVVGAIGGFIGAAVLLPTKLGEALITFRAGKALEKFKAEQAHELEAIKERLTHLGDRGKRSNEMEFVAIETVWKAFVKAWLSTNTCIGQMIEIPGFGTMTDEDVMRFGKGSGLGDQEIKSLIDAEDKSAQYSSILSWRRVREAGTDIYQSRLTLREQRIFMPADLTEQFNSVIEKMSSAQVQRRLSLQHPNIPEYRFGKAQMDWMDECVPIFESMASQANKRLFRAEGIH